MKQCLPGGRFLTRWCRLASRFWSSGRSSRTPGSTPASCPPGGELDEDDVGEDDEHDGEGLGDEVEDEIVHQVVMMRGGRDGCESEYDDDGEEDR